MNEIFLSWAALDKQTVDRIINPIDDAGLPIDEYSRDMRAGEEIRPWIVSHSNTGLCW